MILFFAFLILYIVPASYVVYECCMDMNDTITKGKTVTYGELFLCVFSALAPFYNLGAAYLLIKDKPFLSGD